MTVYLLTSVSHYDNTNIWREPTRRVEGVFGSLQAAMAKWPHYEWSAPPLIVNNSKVKLIATEKVANHLRVSAQIEAWEVEGDPR